MNNELLNLPHLPVKFFDVKNQVKLDTGGVSIISNRTYETLRDHPDFVEYKYQGPNFRCGNGSYLRPHSTVLIDVNIGDRTHSKIPFTFVPGWKDDDTIGMDNLGRLHLTIDARNRQIYFAEKEKRRLVTEDDTLFYFNHTPSLHCDCCSCKQKRKEVKKHIIYGEGDWIPELKTGMKLTTAQKKRFDDIARRYNKAFSKDDYDLGCCAIEPFKIDTGDATPIQEYSRRPSPQDREDVDKYVDLMLKHGIIEESESDWCCRYLFVNQPPRPRRLVNDYRPLNNVTKKDRFPVPDIAELFDRVSKKRIYSKCDMAKGYYQTLVDPGSRHKTAFSTHRGLYQYKRLPFGLANAPANFQRIMNKVFAKLRHLVACYIDDSIIFTDDVDAHLIAFELYLQCLVEAGLKINPKKCEFFCEEIEFLGHTLTKEGIRPIHEKVEAIKNTPEPQTRKQLRSFLGFAGYYRKFVRRFDELSYHLTEGIKKKGNKYLFTEEMRQEFHRLKEAISSTTLLVSYDADKEHQLHTDASITGVGAVLMQLETDKIWRPIAYISKKLTDCQRRYSVTELELLALVWAVAYFRHYLEGKQFTVVTDHMALVYLKTSLGKTSRGSKRLLRWAIELSAYDFNIIHRKGINHVVPDMLSRNPFFDADEKELSLPVLAVRLDSLKEDQRTDSEIKEIINQIEAGKTRDYIFDESGIVRRKTEKFNQLVLPMKDRINILKEYHSSSLSAHIGVVKTYLKIRRKYYWPKMKESIRKFVECCDVCQRTKDDHKRPIGLMGKHEITAEIFSKIAIDYVGPLPVSTDGNNQILVIADYATKYIIASPTRDATTESTIRVLRDDVFTKMGPPRELISDNGSAFKSEAFEGFLRRYNVKHTCSTPGLPRSNGQVERLNGAAMTLLRARMQDEKAPAENWDKYLQEAVYGYNSSPHVVTGLSPYFLLHGQEPRQPVDAEYIKTPEDEGPEITAEKIAEIVKVRNETRDRLNLQQNKNAEKFNKTHRFVYFYLGEMVMLKEANPRKLTPRYSGPYFVIRRLKDNSLVYIIQDVKNPKRRRICSATKLKSYYSAEYAFQKEVPLPEVYSNPVGEITREEACRLLHSSYRIPDGEFLEVMDVDRLPTNDVETNSNKTKRIKNRSREGLRKRKRQRTTIDADVFVGEHEPDGTPHPTTNATTTVESRRDSIREETQTVEATVERRVQHENTADEPLFRRKRRPNPRFYSNDFVSR
ncbi:Retrovirus-related Pol polyprotein from transposon-like protein [Leptotrombidium deliense]|uniref:RNA-directed DNA polymerase n=1 Tax=Leptotrombidium deliense TaxID=299467 RepID=A0A443SAP6_9ACAR|nr:Retrovirus-related Pol polyprotein from transposon-like protein [Leptotrombidium deliense]